MPLQLIIKLPATTATLASCLEVFQCFSVSEFSDLAVHFEMLRFELSPATKSYTLSNVTIPVSATSVLVLLEGSGGEATSGVRSSSSCKMSYQSLLLPDILAI